MQGLVILARNLGDALLAKLSTVFSPARLSLALLVSASASASASASLLVCLSRTRLAPSIRPGDTRPLFYTAPHPSVTAGQPFQAA
jgi:hypothetical protein